MPIDPLLSTHMTCPDADELAHAAAGTMDVASRGLVLDHAATCIECNAALTALMARTAPTSPTGGPTAAARDHLDRYEIVREIGRGAMGVVYVAHDPALARDVALKVLRPQASADRLRREAQALAKLAHPNVVRVYDTGEHDGQTFIAMELVDGQTLRTWLETPRTIAEIVDVLVHAARGLIAAHEAGLIHRDFKPDNVFVATAGQVLVGDFGLARAALPGSSDDVPVATTTAAAISSDSLTRTGTVVGTPAYMAPEQLEGVPSAACDQFAFCVTAWEACFGTRPFVGATLGQIRDRIEAGDLVRPPERAVPPRLERALRRGLAARPTDRFPSMSALVAALEPAPRRRLLWVGIATAAVLATAITLVLVNRTTADPSVDCDAAAGMFAPVWAPATTALLAARNGPEVAATFGQYAQSWRDARIEACRATHVRHEQSLQTLEQRVACLDRARASLQSVLATLVTAAPMLPRAINAVAALPSLERCRGGSGAPPIEQASEIAAVDAALAAVDVALLAGGSNVEEKAFPALRERAVRLGYAPLTLRATMIDARIAMWAGDATRAEAVLRQVMISAEQAADDFTRAHAGGLLAKLLADRRPAEAATLASAARAALIRAGTDPTVEVAVLEGEIATATARRAHRDAALLQERVVALHRARFGDAGPVVHALARLAVLWDRAGDRGKTAEAMREAATLELKGRPDAALLAEDTAPLLLDGDFEGAIELATRQLVALRAGPPALYAEATYVWQIALAAEMALDYQTALERYREAAAIFTRPVAEFATPDAQPDVVDLVMRRANAHVGAGTVLLNLGRADEAVAELRLALAVDHADAPPVAAELDAANRTLGRALVESGHYREGRAILEPVVARLANNPAASPLSLGILRSALGRALWEDGGVRERPRAFALLADAEKDLAAAVIRAAGIPQLRTLPVLIRAEQARLATWRVTHPDR